MVTKYGRVYDITAESRYKKVLINMIYKLLPMRDNGEDWEGYLSSLVLEIDGLNELFTGSIGEVDLIKIQSKLEGLKKLKKDENFALYRKTILECTNLIK